MFVHIIYSIIFSISTYIHKKHFGFSLVLTMIHEIIPGSSPESFNELETNKLRKSIVTTSKLKGFKRSFDIYHDMNIPRVRFF